MGRALEKLPEIVGEVGSVIIAQHPGHFLVARAGLKERPRRVSAPAPEDLFGGGVESLAEKAFHAADRKPHGGLAGQGGHTIAGLIRELAPSLLGKPGRRLGDGWEAHILNTFRNRPIYQKSAKIFPPVAASRQSAAVPRAGAFQLSTINFPFNHG